MNPLSCAYSMTTEVNSACEVPETFTDDEVYEAAPIVLDVHDVLAPLVGLVTDLDLSALGEGAFLWAGLDEAGSPISGTLDIHVDVGDDLASFIVSPEVKVND